MDERQPDPEDPQVLAGAHYHRLKSDKDFCLDQLAATDTRVALAAIALSISHWKMGPIEPITEACCRIAATPTEEVYRCMAVDWLGILYEGSRNRQVCRFLARLILFDSTSTLMVRKRAYDALIGIARDSDSEFPLNLVRVLKYLCYLYPNRFKENEIKERLRISQEEWARADEINWAWVASIYRVASERNDQTTLTRIPPIA